MKKIVSMLLSVMMILALGAPAFAADTTDTYDEHYWSGDDRFDATPYRTKQNGSDVYFRIANNSLPVGGVDFQSQLSQVGGGYVYSNWHRIMSNSSFSLNHKAGLDAGWRPVRLTTYYPASRYNWGSVEIYWSPDYVYDGSTRLV